MSDGARLNFRLRKGLRGQRPECVDGLDRDALDRLHEKGYISN